MGNTIIEIFTDASFKDGRCGYAFVYRRYKKIAPTVVYGSCDSTSSTAAELTAIIKSLQYMRSLSLTTHPLIIRCDVESIVLILKEKRYKKWEQASWMKSSGNPITPDLVEWRELTNLKKEFSIAPVGFKKSNSYNKFNYVAHCYGRIGLKHTPLEDEFIFTGSLKNNHYGNPIAENIEKITIQNK